MTNSSVCADQVVIVTGAARGMGRLMALGIANAGASVVVVDQLQDELNGVMDEIKKQTACPPLAIALDVTDERAVSAMVKSAIERFGRIDALVNNAGIGPYFIRKDFKHRRVGLWEVTPEKWRRMVDVNLNGFFYVTSTVLHAMLPRRRGRIVTVTTSLYSMINRGSVVYGGTKAAIEANMSALALDLKYNGIDGITANVLIPGGPVDTPFIPNESGFDRATLIRPEVMVPPVLWLLSDQAKNVSGYRIIAQEWDSRLPVEQAFAASSAPIAWPQIGGQPLDVGGQTRR